MICIPITARDNDAAGEQISRAAPLCDIIELRLDYISRPDVEGLIRSRPLPVIATCRPGREGGLFVGEEADRLDILRRAAAAGAEYIDVELDSVAELGRAPARRIVSHHDFEQTPDDLGNIYQSLAETGADVVKLATKANSVLDNLRMFELLERSDRPTIGLCMGDDGRISRILAGRFGGLLTFAALDDASASAPGQLTVQTLREMYRYERITPKTDIYGVVANPVAHSMSPAIHNAAFRELDLDAVYLPFRVDDPLAFYAAFRHIVKGYSVTIPHKVTSMQAMDELDPKVNEVGALNTIVVRDGKLVGCNVEWLAAIEALEAGIGEDASYLRGRRVLVIGAGGATRAICVGLREREAIVTIANRTAEKARRLAVDLGAGWLPLADLRSIEADVIINTTSVGMHPNVDACPVDVSLLRKGMVVCDIVYNPLETLLLREAKAHECAVVDGLGMFVRQAANQFRLWTKREPPIELMTDLVMRILKSKA